MINKKDIIVSLNVESNGLFGNPFLMSAIAYNGEQEISKICLRLEDVYVTDSYVIDNILPNLKNVKVTHKLENLMYYDFRDWYASLGESTVIFHMGNPVESNCLRLLHQKVGMDYPYAPIELSTLMRLVSPNEYDSVDAYVKGNRIEVDYTFEQHKMYYDCSANYRTLQHILKRLEKCNVEH